MRLDSFLPPAALPRFQAFRVAQPELIWTNPDGGDAVSFDAHAYFLPLQGDSSAVHLSTTEEFAAERYGGHGIATNGGGARCGVAGTLQIKGIGQNVVAGFSNDFFHTYGGASLNEGIVEAIWGEIFHNVLPHGSVRVRALIGTGTRVPLVLPVPGEDPTTARGLIIRDAALRPAHYMRAPHFRPLHPEAITTHDTDRTRAAVRKLPMAMQAIFGDSLGSVAGPEYLNERIAGVFYRFGQQVAAARTKRLMHGSLLASNISLDGRWLDFGTASSVPTWGHIVSPKGPDFLQEELMLHPMAVEFIFSLRKYLPPTVGATLRSTESFWSEICRGVQDELPWQFLKLTGVPVESRGLIDGALVTATWNALDKAIRAGNQRRFLIMSDNSAESLTPYRRTGSYDLLRLLRALALSDTAESADLSLESIVPEPPLRAELARTFHAVRHAYLSQCPEDRRYFAAHFCKLNALRFTSTLVKLYRPRMYHDVGHAVANKSDLGEVINDMISYARLVLYDDDNGRIDLTFLFGKPAVLDVRTGVTVAKCQVDMQEAIKVMSEFLDHEESTSAVRHYES